MDMCTIFWGGGGKLPGKHIAGMTTACTPSSGQGPLTFPCSVKAGTVIIEYKALTVDLKDKNFYDHCFVAVHAVNMWPWWDVAQHTPTDLPAQDTLEDVVVQLMPARVLDMAAHLASLPTFFEEFDLVCPWLDYYDHSATPNCRLWVTPCANCKHHIVKIVALTQIHKTDKLTLLHAPQDLLGPWSTVSGTRPAHYVPHALDIPPDDGSEAHALASGILTPDWLRSVSLVIRHAHVACSSTAFGSELSMFQLFLYLVGSRLDVCLSVGTGSVLKNAHMSRLQRVKVRNACATPHGVINEPCFWKAVAHIFGRFRSKPAFQQALDTFLRNAF